MILGSLFNQNPKNNKPKDLAVTGVVCLGFAFLVLIIALITELDGLYNLFAAIIGVSFFAGLFLGLLFLILSIVFAIRLIHPNKDPEHQEKRLINSKKLFKAGIMSAILFLVFLAGLILLITLNTTVSLGLVPFFTIIVGLTFSVSFYSLISSLILRIIYKSKSVKK